MNGHEGTALNEDALAQTLQWASSNSQQQIQIAAGQLERWQTAPGFYKHLQTIFITRAAPVELRYLAIIQLKNGIDKYWRKTATNAVGAEDKNAIRSRLIESGLTEDDQRLALQNALVIAKIVRYEYPQTWPDVVTALLDAIRSSAREDGAQMRLARAQLMLLYIVKELASSRLARSRQNLNALTPEIVGVLGGIYIDLARRWQATLGGGNHTPDVEANMELSLLSIRIVRRLLVGGYDFPNRNSEVVEFWKISRELFESFVSFHLASSEHSRASETHSLLGRHLLQLSKLHLKMAQGSGIASALLPDSLGIARTYWNIITQCGDFLSSRNARENRQPQLGTEGDKTGDRTVFERVTLMGMLLIRAYIKMSCNPTQSLRYRKQEDKDEELSARKLVREGLLTEAFIVDIMNITVSRYFVLRDSELWEWEEEPEEWETKEENEGEGYEFSLRPCAERLFLDVSLNFIDILQQPLKNLFDRVATPDFDNVLLKESVYSALGIAAPKIHQHVDFNSLLTSTLASDAQNSGPLCHILRRRVTILIGQWITIQVSKDNRPLVYQIYEHMLDPSVAHNDLVVRITAGRHFRNVADDWEFDPVQFLPHAPKIMTRLMKLVEEVETMETKLALLNTISVAVERLDHHIAPYASQIIELLPPLWDQSGDEHIMKQAILALLTRLVTAMKASSAPFHSSLIPIIQGVVERGSESQLYLLDDALDLWHAILTQSPQPSRETLSLIPCLFDVFELGSEGLRKALEITESYVLLAPNDMLSDSIRKPILASLSALLVALRPDESGILSNVVELLIRRAEVIGGEAAVKQIVLDLVETQFLTRLLEGLHEAYIAHQGTGPLSHSPSVDGLIETDYFSVLARLALGSTSTFIDAVRQIVPAPTHSGDSDPGMAWVVDEWFKHMDNVSDPSRRKLLTMALTNLLESNQRFILGNLQLLMSLWTSVIMELRELNFPAPGDEGRPIDPMTDQLVFDDPSNVGTEQEAVPSPEDERRKQLEAGDIVKRVRLPEYVRAYLSSAVRACGGEEAFQMEWLVNVDKEIAEGFGSLGIM